MHPVLKKASLVLYLALWVAAMIYLWRHWQDFGMAQKIAFTLAEALLTPDLHSLRPLLFRKTK
jgi:hypothetical protein